MGTDRPDVVLIVMDCVRYDFFTDQVENGSLPFLSSARDEFLRFSRAVAPASWTIPSHASLFTGLYPWDHGAHYKGGTILGPSAPTLAEFLRARGYRTSCLSANGYIQPDTGLTRGFENVLWGGDREFFLRFLAQRASCPLVNSEGAAVHAILDRGSTASPLRAATMRTLSRYTALCDALNRVGGKVVDSSPAYVGAWIEREFDRTLSEAAGQPVFVFVNLLEAHEPYLAEAGRSVGLRDWLSYANTTQVSDEWIAGGSRPTERDVAWARRNYRSSMKVIDERIRSLVAQLSSHDRWENALVILTSDHGQTLGEGGSMYHRLSLEEAITRIPLWVKPHRPGFAPPGIEERSWVSLTDVPATVASAVEPGTMIGDRGAIPLGSAGRANGRAVYSMTDGLPKREATLIPEARRVRLDRVQIAGYRDSFKTIVDQSGTQYHWKFEGGGARPLDSDPGGDPSFSAEMLVKLRSVLSLPEPASVSQRIAGWGY